MAVKGANQKQPVGTSTPGNNTPGVPLTDTGGARPVSDRLTNFATDPTPAAPAPPVPPPDPNVDPKGFQHYLNIVYHAGLTEDGIVGPKTLAAAQKFGVSIPAPTPPPAPTKTAPQNTAPPQSQSTVPTNTPDVAAAVAYAKQRFGYAAAALDDPEVMNVLTQAVQNNWSDQQRLTALEATKFYQNTSENVIGWDTATAGQRADLTQRALDSLTQDAATMGIAIAPDRLQQMAQDMAKNGYSSSSPEWKNALAAEFHYTAGGQTGAIGAAESQIRQIAADYYIPISDSTLASLDQKVAQGIMTPDDYKATAIAQAKSLYNNEDVNRALDQGMTMKDISDPYRQDAANELGLNPDQIDFTQPMWMKALSYRDPTTGVIGMMSRSDWMQNLRSDPQYGWDRTPNGVAAGYNVVNALGQALGVK